MLYIADLFGLFASHFWKEKKDLYMNEFDMCLVRRRGYVVDRAYTSFVIPCNNNENNNHNRLLVRYTRIFIYICVCHLTISSMVRFRCLNIWLLGNVHIHWWWLLKNKKQYKPLVMLVWIFVHEKWATDSTDCGNKTPVPLTKRVTSVVAVMKISNNGFFSFIILLFCPITQKSDSSTMHLRLKV